MSSEQTNNDPWSNTAPAQDDPWSQGTEAAPSNDWLNSETVEQAPFDIMNPFQDAVLPSIAGRVRFELAGGTWSTCFPSNTSSNRLYSNVV